MTTQVAVIGGGPGGYAAAFYAADLGMQVTLVDTEVNPGGVCLYRGCIPSKALLHVARLLNEAKEAERWGISFGTPRIDLGKLRAWKSAVVDKLTGGVGQLARQRKIVFVQGRASFTGPSDLRIEKTDGTTEDLRFEHAVLATGSRAAVIGALAVDSQRVMDSTAALELADVPASLLVIGGGYIGLELGSVYAALGSRVTVVEMTGGLLPGADRDLVNILARQLEKRFASIRLNTTVASMTADDKEVRVAVADGGGSEELAFDKALVSVGRVPNSRGLGLEHTGVALDARGFVVVDSQRRTAEPRIFAIGDLTGEPQLAHKASHEARVAIDVIAGGKAAFEPRAIPAVVFTDPEIAWAGLTESRAKQEGIDIAVARFPWGASGRATTLDRFDGVTKLLIDPATERVLGVGMCGPGAGELIAEGVLAMEMGATARDIALSIHPHPTLSETVMEAAEVFFGQSTHVYRPKK